MRLTVRVITAVARHLRHVIARTVHDGRTALGWSQEHLSERSGVSRPMVARVESASVNVSVDVAGKLLSALGVAVRLEVDAPFVARRQVDAVHARCVGYVRRRLEAAGWTTASEVEVAAGRARGWIDILAFDPESRTLLVIEVKTDLVDIGGTERQLRWYRASAVRAAEALGWKPRRVEVALLVLAANTNDACLADNADLVRQSFPADAGQLQALVREGEALPGPAVAFVDPGSRRQQWLMRGRIHGRRTPFAHADYADFMRRVQGGRRRRRPPGRIGRPGYQQ
jgi:transcriptional regulator with XRE-family HTH domain